MEESSLNAVPQAAPANPIPPQDLVPKTSRGERWFNGLVYGGLAGVGAFVVTVPLAFSLKYGAGKSFHRVVMKGFEAVARILPWRASSKFAEEAAMTTTLMQGGNAMLIPVGIAEHYKVPLVEKLNRMLGDNTPPAAVDETPKQTWMSLIKARLTAWTVVFVSMMGASKLFEGTLKTFEHEFAVHVCKLFRSPIEQIEGEALKPTKPYLYGKLGALDVFATAAAATLLYTAGHLFARRQEQKAERQAIAEAHGEPLRDEATGADVATQIVGDKAQTPVQPASHITGAKLHEGVMINAQHAQAI